MGMESRCREWARPHLGRFPSMSSRSFNNYFCETPPNTKPTLVVLLVYYCTTTVLTVVLLYHQVQDTLLTVVAGGCFIDACLSLCPPTFLLCLFLTVCILSWEARLSFYHILSFVLVLCLESYKSDVLRPLPLGGRVYNGRCPLRIPSWSVQLTL